MTNTQTKPALNESFTFRLRIHLGDDNRLLLGQKYTIPSRPGRASVDVIPWNGNEGSQTIDQSDWLLFKGECATEAEAWHQGQLLVDQLCRVFARMRVKAEMGKPPTGTFTEAGRKEFFGDDRSALDDVHGLMVYRTDTKPRFVSMGQFRLGLGHAHWRFEQMLAAASDQPLNAEEKIAWNLFSGSAFEYSSAARLLMLVMSVETLLSPPKRGNAAITFVNSLITQTQQEPTLSDDDRSSLISALGSLRKESITRSGILLLDQKLAGRAYSGRSAEAIWREAYSTRSALAHGRQAPSEDVDRLAGRMSEIVGDLLSGSLLAFEPQVPQPNDTK